MSKKAAAALAVFAVVVVAVATHRSKATGPVPATPSHAVPMLYPANDDGCYAALRSQYVKGYVMPTGDPAWVHACSNTSVARRNHFAEQAAVDAADGK